MADQISLKLNIKLKIEWVFTVAALAIVLSTYSWFLNLVESRAGVTLNDPILPFFTPVDFSLLISVMIYLAFALALGSMRKDADQLVFALQCYATMAFFRMLCLYLIPLDPPVGIIPLDDPFVQLFTFENANAGTMTAPLTKDLFFSSHTATMFLLSLVTRHVIIKKIIFIGFPIMGLLMMWQHVHYSIDVAVAPFMAFGSYSLVSWLRKKLKRNH